ncbi:MAG: hemolysin family protein [Candidatus Borkfalkiaceae bacterium]|nr:hemolysin family protein [Christensenellaceae bacterium]
MSGLQPDPEPEPDSMAITIICIVILVLLSGFFSATETAYSSVNKTKLKLKAQEGGKAAQNAFNLSENFDKLLSAILVGNNIVNISLSVLFNGLFENAIPQNPALSGVISVAVSTVIVLTFGEIAPKMIAKENSERFCIASGYPIRFVMIILTPITILFAGLKVILKKICKSNGEEKITEEELLSMVEEAQEDGALDEKERELISSAIEFDDAEVEDILVPRVNVIAVPLDMPMDKIKALFLEHNFSRMPVYKDTIDQVIGMIHNIDFFAALEKGEKSIKNAITPVAVATEHMKISTLLKSMQMQKVHMAVVVDEYGGTMGIVTLEDILEELVGEIWDEHDEIVNYFSKIDDNTYMVDGRAELDKFFEMFGLDADEAEKFDSQTVSGWVIEQTGDIPKKFQSFDYKNLTIIVNRLTQRRVLDVKVIINPEPEEDGEKN